jgi:LacI family transcriptional regulator
MVLDAVKYARKMKLRINKDISFVSYANFPLSHYTAYPPLASVEQYPYLQGQKATETLLELLAKDAVETESSAYYRIILESQLIINDD